MTIVPIKVEPASQTKLKFVEWMLHNVCNHDCSFCGNSIKDGSKRWLTIDKYKEYADKIINLCNNQPFWMQFTGGEPTLFPELLDLMDHVKSKGAYVSLISNGTRTLRWWEELRQKKCLDHLYITYHSEQTSDYKHIVDVLNTFHSEQVNTICLITHTATSIDLAIEARKYIEEHTGSTVLFKAMIIGDYDIYELYNTEQLIEVKRSWSFGVNRRTKTPPLYPDSHKMVGMLSVTYDDGSVKRIDPQHLLKSKQHTFINWNCEVGMDTMRIVVDEVFRGVCEVGGKQYSLDDNISFSTEGITCSKRLCTCTTDLVTTKTK